MINVLKYIKVIEKNNSKSLLKWFRDIYIF